MCVGINDFMRTLSSVENLSSLNQVYSTCVTGVFENKLFLVSSCWGRTMKVLRAPFALFGKMYFGTIENTLKKTKKVFYDFLEYIANPKKEPSRLTLSICVLCHSPEWEVRLLHLHRLMKMKLKISVRVAARLSSSVAFEQLTAMDVPWRVLERILEQREIDLQTEVELISWIKVIEGQMSKIPKELLFGTFRQVSCNLNSRSSEEEQTDDAFFLAFLLNAKFENLFLCDNIFEKLQAKMTFGKKKVNIEFTEKFHISAYSILGQPARSVLVSPRPFMLCSLGCYLLRKQNTFPLLTVYEQGKEGEYLIVEGLVGSLDASHWGQAKGVSKSNQPLADSFVGIVKNLLQIDITLELNLKKFLVTENLKICLTEQLEKAYDFVFAYDIEKFIQQGCHNDAARIAYVMERSGFFTDRYAMIFPRVLKTIHEVFNVKRDSDLKKGILAEDVLAVLYGNDLYSAVLCEAVVEYLTKVIVCLKKADSIFKGEVSAQRLVKAIFELQHEIGFMTCIPDKLAQAVVKKIQKEKSVPIPCHISQAEISRKDKEEQETQSSVPAASLPQRESCALNNNSNSMLRQAEEGPFLDGIYGRIRHRWKERYEKFSLRS